MKTVADIIKTCSNCKGLGDVILAPRVNRVILFKCPICKGTGKNKQNKDNKKSLRGHKINNNNMRIKI